MPPSRRVFKDCTVCEGRSGRPRNGDGGLTCSASKCKKAYAQKRASSSLVDERALVTAVVFDVMPENMSVQELKEILGERCCRPQQMSYKKRKNGPGSSYFQEYLVRGGFLVAETEDDDDDDDDEPEPNTYWVDEQTLLETISKDDVKDALKARHNNVIEQM